MSYRDNIFTVFDLMEKKGFFRQNPANVDSFDKDTRQTLYKGPVEYPKMMYEPKGKMRVTVPAEVINTPFGPQRVGEQKELISKLVESKEEEAVLRQLGWHYHPAKAIHAGGGEAPPITSSEQISSLEEQVKALMKQLEDAKADKAALPDEDEEAA